MTYLLHLLHNLFFKQYKKSIHQQKLWFCSLLHRIRSARICYYTPAACKGRKGHRTNFHHVWSSRMQRSIIIGRMVNCPSRYASLGERVLCIYSIRFMERSGKRGFHSSVCGIYCAAATWKLIRTVWSLINPW